MKIKEGEDNIKTICPCMTGATFYKLKSGFELSSEQRQVLCACNYYQTLFFVDFLNSETVL